MKGQKRKSLYKAQSLNLCKLLVPDDALNPTLAVNDDSHDSSSFIKILTLVS
jgi:hypothetical protein